ncbi:MAG: TIGR04282 family arsenosugar biosynthesis glycosyltransferase [Sandaracinaceae bacterium]
MSADDGVELAIFAKAPTPGRVKTRLAPRLGDDGAAALYAAFLRDVVAKAAGRLPYRLWAADGPDLEGLEALGLGGLPPRVQLGGTLGRRMAEALDAGLAAAPRSLLVGSDLPTLPASYLERARDALARADVVLGPAADGGYYLIGTRTRGLDLEGPIRWSSPFALRDTVRALRAQGRSVTLVGPWYDVDRPEDLRLLDLHLTLDPGAAPRTARERRRSPF